MDDYEEMDLDQFRALVHGIIDVEIGLIHKARMMNDGEELENDVILNVFEEMVALAMHRVGEAIVKEVFKEAYEEEEDDGDLPFC